MKGKTLRFVNFILDTLIYLSITTLIVYVFKNQIAQDNVKWISVLIYFLYYFLFEFIMKQTPGKLITRSAVITISKNYNYFFAQILLRTLMRFIPLDILSYLFVERGLHDWISKTTVAKMQ
jgi:uncharacterized RDD family membrane protein YckC